MTTDQQTVDSYDNGAKNYTQEKPKSFYHKYVEKPAMYKLLPDLKGKKVLCIGCGTGEEVNYLSSLGAEVIGTDLSKGMLIEAKNNFPDLDFRQMDMMRLDFSKNTFDFVYSSLAFHYTNDLENLFAGIYKILKSGGKLLFSTTHPVFDAVEIFDLNGEQYSVIGKSKNLATKEIKTIGDYFSEIKRTQDWGNNFIVNVEHKTISTWINSLIKPGFRILKMVEPKPIEEAKEKYPEKYKEYIKRPGYMIFLTEK